MWPDISGRGWPGNTVGGLANIHTINPKYHVDATYGLDTNDGLTPQTAWKTLTKVNATSFVAGDVIGFKRGETFTGVLTVPTSGAINNPIIFGSYGTGALPIIEHAVAATATVVTINSKNNIRLLGLNVKNNNGNVGHRSIYILGTCSGVEVIGCSVFSSGYGVLSTALLTNSKVDLTTVTGGTAIGIYIYGNDSQNITVSKCLVSNGGGVSLRYISNVTCSNNTVHSGTNTYNGIQIYNCSGILTANGNLVRDGLAANSGFYILNNTFTSGACFDNICKNSGGAGLLVSNSHNLTFYNCLVEDNPIGTGYRVDSASYNILFYGCMSKNNKGDGYATTNAHDITFTYCRASGNGNIATTADGDGFTSHLNDYNINCLYCIADYNKCSGWAMVGFSQGLIYNCIAYKNASNWISEGGVDQVRGGFTFYSEGVNPTTGTTWEMRNCIGVGNYPRELYVDRRNANIDIDNCQYFALDADNFANINGAASNISWDTYHATYEANSAYGNPAIVSDSNIYPLLPILIGENLGATFEDALDISTNWGNENQVPSVVTKKQPSTGLWQVGAYVQ